MKNRRGQKNGILIGMITVAVAGLLAVQLALLSIAWDLKDQAFRRNAVSALTETVRDLEAGEIAGDALEVIYRIGDGDERENDWHEESNRLMRRFEIQTKTPRILHAEKMVLDTTSIDATFVLPEINRHLPRIWKNVTVDSFHTPTNWTVISNENRTELIEHIVGDLVIRQPKPIRERLHPAHIDSLLGRNLHEVGIELEPEFGVLAPDDELILVSENRSGDEDTRRLLATPLRAQLFPLDIRPEAHQILVRFPGQRGYLLRQVGPLLAASILFILVIIATFVLTLTTIGKQNRFFERIIDFINNMTHEFKTPISTVSLASEAIARTDILERPEALERYNRMIRDENLRMRRQVEKILQIAQLEAGDFHLNVAAVDLHELANDTAAAFALQIEDRGGTLQLELEAETAFVRGDPVHLGNVLANLLDNAIKYSPGPPEIELKTTSGEGGIVLEVRDHGVGISRADQAHVFEKYYRCPTGDRHDVKGYGLGLSFVRLLVEAHGGSVSLDSAPEQGTRVVIALPLDRTAPFDGRTT